MGSLKKVKTRPLGDIMRALKKNRRRFQRRVRDCSSPGMPIPEQFMIGDEEDANDESIVVDSDS